MVFVWFVNFLVSVNFLILNRRIHVFFFLWYSYEVLLNLDKEKHRVDGPIYYYVFNTLLYGLLVLHVYWWVLIYRMLAKQIQARGHLSDDVRSGMEEKHVDGMVLYYNVCMLVAPYKWNWRNTFNVIFCRGIYYPEWEFGQANPDYIWPISLINDVWDFANHFRITYLKDFFFFFTYLLGLFILVVCPELLLPPFPIM